MHLVLLSRLAIVITVSLTVLISSIAAAATNNTGWQPPPPMPDDFDWIQLVSDEWLKGEIIEMFDDKLEFDSDELDLQSFDWEDIKQLRSAGVMRVGFERGVSAIGQVFIDEDTVRVMGAKDQQFDRDRLLSITAGEPKVINYWSIKAGLGANASRGNTEQTEANANLKAVRRTLLNRISVEYLGNYILTDGVQTANKHRVNGIWDRFLNRRLFVKPVTLEWFRDPFQNIDYRATVGVGAGYQLIDTDRTEWRLSGGVGYQQTKFDDVAESDSDTEDTAAFSISSKYDIELTKWMDFLSEYRAQFVNSASGKYNHHFVVGFETELTRLLDLDISLVWDRIEQPRADSEGNAPKQNDFRILFGISFDF